VKQRGKTITTFGGPGSIEQVKQTCLARMQEWVSLCDYIIAAEFPDFELIHAFWIFNVVTGSRTKTGHGYFDDDPELVAACATERAAAFARLATAFGVDEVALTEQFNKCLPTARHRAMHYGCSNAEAWKFAAFGGARHMKMNSLLSVLQRYLGFGISTSGVEHTFSTMRDALAHRKQADLRKVRRLYFCNGNPRCKTLGLSPGLSAKRERFGWHFTVRRGKVGSTSIRAPVPDHR
jgi:hypothetical protein